jgi:hypothetical protein
VVITIIVYGSLYPFEFRQPIGGLGPAALALLKSWNETPSRGDFIANVALYMPRGFFTVLAIGKGVGAPTRIALAILIGALLSTCMVWLGTVLGFYVRLRRDGHFIIFFRSSFSSAARFGCSPTPGFDFVHRSL